MTNMITLSKVINVAAHTVELHFKGYLKGEKVEKILLERAGQDLQQGETYLVYLKEVKIIKYVLHAKLVKKKNIREVYF